ncbi:GNAT family N-acetyltransferase [Agromyces silvae]|uniref:GNAT family N-acetyltransferase n=1 Tax=Agromyces silvae TaxID=3388266 RepID=UPI00280BB273|nr:GNAT family N-acetyltransferase [Agromyces protaetiae]
MNARESYLHVAALDRADLDEAAALLGRGMADNPMHVAVYGRDEGHRARCHTRLMRTHLARSKSLRVEVMTQAGALTAVAASLPPGRCRPGLATRLHLVGTATTFGLGTASRLLAWQQSWATHDLTEPHVHLGPIAVDRHLRGRGMGGLLMLRHIGRLDSVGAVGYLETDRPEAVGFYRRYGYVVVGESAALGVRTWFMRRPPT